MDYLLDTNVCIAIINGRQAIRARLQRAVNRGDHIFVSSIAAHELRYGVAKSRRQDFNRKRLEAFLAGPLTVLSFEDEDGQIAGTIRATLEAPGKPVGAYDVLMAGQALRHRMTLVTADTSEFSRVKGLSSQDWEHS